MENLKREILSNRFIDLIREQMVVDEAEYKALCKLLDSLSGELSNETWVDKELALILYSIPQTVRNTYLSFCDGQELPEIASRLEDIWVELDEQVSRCLS